MDDPFVRKHQQDASAARKAVEKAEETLRKAQVEHRVAQTKLAKESAPAEYKPYKPQFPI